jgi:hypothetical protein
LDLGRKHVPPEFNRLVHNYTEHLRRDGNIDLYAIWWISREWAQRFDLQDTWVEDWAIDTIRNWVSNENISTSAASSRKWLIAIPRPTDPILWFRLPGVRVPAICNKETFARDIRNELAQATGDLLDGWMKARIRDRSIVEIAEPTDLERKLECAALYYFARLRPQDIANPEFRKIKGLALRQGAAMPSGSRENISRWIKEVSKILRLPVRPAGWRPQNPVAKKTVRSAKNM